MIEERLKAGIMRRMSAVKENDKEVLDYKREVSEIKIADEADKKLSKILYDDDQEFGLGNDTYAMAFKAFNWDVAAQMDLSPTDVWNAYHAALFVAGVQWSMIFFIVFMMGTYENFVIVFPKDLATMAARFICTILMHLQVESDIRQGLRMMKYSINHSDDFSGPFNAFLIGFLQMIGGLSAEIACIFYLSSINTPMDVIIRFIAMGSIAKVDDFYASALPDDNRIKGKSKPMTVKLHRRDHQEGKIKPTMSYWLGRFIFKFFRILYASFIFYFMPYMILLLPYAFQ